MIYISLALLVIIVAIISVLVLRVVLDMQNPIRRSPDDIKKSILALTPIGMSMGEVLNIIESNEKWDVSNVNEKSGYREPGTSNTIIGEKSIKVNMGFYITLKYIIPLDTFVFVFWGFNENSELIDVYVFKDTVGF